jgi:hypothetical protein
MRTAELLARSITRCYHRPPWWRRTLRLALDTTIGGGLLLIGAFCALMAVAVLYVILTVVAE